MITEKKPKLKNMKKIYILNNENNQLYFHFDDLDKIIKFKQIKNINLTNEPTKITLLDCHTFCTECIMPWLQECNDTCPICRKKIEKVD